MKWSKTVNTAQPLDDNTGFNFPAVGGNRYNGGGEIVRPAISGEVVRYAPAHTDDPMAALVAGLMAESRTIHTADPVNRGHALFIKTLGFSLFLWGLTVAALALSDSLEFMIWLLWASIEGGIVFVILAYFDWREHPSSIRWKWTGGLLAIMEREQRARLRAQYGDEGD